MPENIHADPTPRKISRAYAISTFKHRDEWIKTLLADGRIDPIPKVVCTRIALHRNIKTGQCDPSIERLVVGTGLSESTVRRAIKELECQGWIRVDRTEGRYRNSYVLLEPPTLSDVEGLNPVASDRVQKAPTLSPVTPLPCQERQGNPVTADTPKEANRKANRKAKERVSPPPLALDEDSGRRAQSDLASVVATDFEEWWQAYPKRVAKVSAFKAYRAVITKGLATAEVLLAGAVRYAAERHSQDPKYTKHPATWLNGGCWADEAAPAPIYPQGPPVAGMSPHIANAAAMARQAQARRQANG